MSREKNLKLIKKGHKPYKRDMDKVEIPLPSDRDYDRSFWIDENNRIRIGI